jgi:hypothetical protein
MSFKRIISTDSYQSGLSLTRSLIAIGIKIGDQNINENVNIEDTLIAGALEGVAGDYRVLSLITNWIEIHFERINVDRFYRAIKASKNTKLKCYFSSLAYLFLSDSRFKKFKSLYKGDRMLLGLTDEYIFLVKKHGEDSRFEKSKLIVAKYTLRDRKDDIFSVEQLSNYHTTYYYRLLIGPSYRADMMAQLSLNSKLTATELAHRTYGSFATAWDVIQDFKYLNLKAG